jgi:hypothetical protein
MKLRCIGITFIVFAFFLGAYYEQERHAAAVQAEQEAR